ncbi:DUF4158 domain-containing protein [Streptosporangium sp. NPDC006013]|uniref:DUF4158 domain-containing protein n=1 Tax=Streptosporangium sp. NPDC006013 TaxID=3155596 RepID=UPI0033BF78C2
MRTRLATSRGNRNAPEIGAEQLGVDPVCAPEYLIRPKIAYEHAWEIRDLLELSEFSEREQEVRDHLAARVLDGIGANTAVQFVGGRLQLEKLGAAEEPPLMKELRSLLDDMVPRLDFPELLLEVFDRTGLPADFTHISGAHASKVA